MNKILACGFVALSVGLSLGETTSPPASQPAATQRVAVPKFDNWVFTWTVFQDEGMMIKLQRKPEGDLFIVSTNPYGPVSIIPRDVDAVGLLLSKSKEYCARQKELAKSLKNDYTPQREDHKVGDTTVTFTAYRSGTSRVTMGNMSMSSASAESLGDVLKNATGYITALNAKMKIVN